MRLLRRTSLFAAFYLLASAATAHAECAWVLWNDEARLDYGTHTESRLWHTIAGSPRKPECEARLRQEIERVTRSDNPPRNVRITVLGDAIQLLHFRSDKPDQGIARVQTFRYVCLPDTMDPRGPKGK